MRRRPSIALLDRLTDDAPDSQVEGAAQADASRGRLRQSILRDLSWLFNTSPLGAGVDLDAYPEVAASTVNYGIAARVGLETDGADPTLIRWDILRALELFEPRFAPDSLDISLIKETREGAFQFRIEAELLDVPQPLRMVMRTEHGGRTAGVRVIEMHRGER
jgi:type VI secretion system protein ImpF